MLRRLRLSDVSGRRRCRGTPMTSWNQAHPLRIRRRARTVPEARQPRRDAREFSLAAHELLRHSTVAQRRAHSVAWSPILLFSHLCRALSSLLHVCAHICVWRFLRCGSQSTLASVLYLFLIHAPTDTSYMYHVALCPHHMLARTLLSSTAFRTARRIQK